MPSNKKESWSVGNLSEYRLRIDEQTNIIEMKSYLQKVFVEIGDIISALTLQVHLLKSSELASPDKGQQEYLQNFFGYLNTLQKHAVSADIAINEGLREITSPADQLFVAFIQEKEKEFQMKLGSIEELSTEEVFETIENEFQYVFASSERCNTSLPLVVEKGDFYAVWEEVSLCALSLDFVLHFFEKWLQTKEIFIQ
jgi:hypothetical protein